VAIKRLGGEEKEVVSGCEQKDGGEQKDISLGAARWTASRLRERDGETQK
jgi:hypothetical protein